LNVAPEKDNLSGRELTTEVIQAKESQARNIKKYVYYRANTSYRNI
jgi:hypothetical protein